jgi:hypothetical protein
MSSIEYLRFDQVNPELLMSVVNEESLRAHLVEHPCFDSKSIREWIMDKTEIDTMDGCRIRVISIGGEIAGWCGIQPDDKGFEIAIVISQKFWGVGMSIFKTLKCWAVELGHKEVLIHLLDTRREYKALAKAATKVSHTQLLGRSFTTYYFSVVQQNA